MFQHWACRELGASGMWSQKDSNWGMLGQIGLVDWEGAIVR